VLVRLLGIGALVAGAVAVAALAAAILLGPLVFWIAWNVLSRMGGRASLETFIGENAASMLHWSGRRARAINNRGISAPDTVARSDGPAGDDRFRERPRHSAMLISQAARRG
jgi:hypothetical protein